MKKIDINRKKALFIFAVLILFPVIPWGVTRIPEIFFGGPQSFFAGIGQVTALVGTVTFSLVVIMKSSLFNRILDRKQFESLIIFGETASLLLLVTHPLMMFVRMIPIVSQDTTYILPDAAWALRFGMYALLLLVILSFAQYCVKGEGRLKNVPLILAAILLFGTLHAFFIPNTLSENVVLKIYTLSLVGLALGSCLPVALLETKQAVQRMLVLK